MAKFLGRSTQSAVRSTGPIDSLTGKKGSTRPQIDSNQKLLWGPSHIRPFQPLFIDGQVLGRSTQSAVRLIGPIDSLIGKKGSTRPQIESNQKLFWGPSHIRPFQPLFIDGQVLGRSTQSAVRLTCPIDSLIGKKGSTRPQIESNRNSFGGQPYKTIPTTLHRWPTFGSFQSIDCPINSPY